jgi:hypothetical protein
MTFNQNYICIIPYHKISRASHGFATSYGKMSQVIFYFDTITPHIETIKIIGFFPKPYLEERVGMLCSFLKKF